jgi:TonB family protein
MEIGRARRLLLIAFALSLLVHAIIALRMNWPFAAPREEPQFVSVEHRPRIVTIAKMPTTPSQTPKPIATAVPTTAPAAKPAKATGSKGAQIGAASTGAAPAHTPVPTPAPTGEACTKPEAQAALVTPPTPPDLAPAVRASATNAVIRVQVKLDDRGTVTEATVSESSGNGSLDLVAVSMARSAQYAPAYHACKAIAGTYTFSARFIPW